MPITDLLTQIEVAPGLPGPLTDSGVTQRAGSKTPPSSDYRDKLARSLNDAPAEQSSRTSSNTPKNSDPAASDRNVAARDNTSTTRNVPQKGAPDRSADTSAPDNSNATEATPGSSDENDVQNDSSVASGPVSAGADNSSDQPVTVDIKIDEPTADEISNAAIAILTVTAAVPELVKVEDDGPSPPQGLYQLLQTDPVNADADPQFTVATTADQDVQPPSGFVEAIFTPTLPTDNGRQITKQADSFSTVQTPSNGKVVGSSQQVEINSVVVATTPEAAPTQPLSDGYAITDVTLTTSVTNDVANDTEKGKSARDDNQPQQPVVIPVSQQTQQVHAAAVQPAPESLSPQKAATASGGSPTLEQVAPVQEPHRIKQTDAPPPTEPEAQTTTKQSDKTEQNTTVADKFQDTIGIKTSDSTKQDAATTAESNADFSQSGVTESNGTGQPVPTHHADPIASTHSTSQAASGQLKVGAHSLADQVSNAMQYATETGRALRVRLHPPELGVLQIEISSKDGLLTARLETQTASAHQAIVENLGSLREALAHTGSRVEQIEVQVAENQASDNLSQHADRQDDDPQQQDGQQQRQQEAHQEQEDDADRPARPAPNAIDQLDIQI